MRNATRVNATRTKASSDEAIAERRQQILEVAAGVITASGVERCTFAAVADASGFSIGMLQHYFRTREKLISSTIGHRIGQSEREWRELGTRYRHPLARVRALLSFAVVGERSFAEAWGFWLEMYAAARKDEELQKQLNDALALWRRIFVDALSEAADSGLIAPRLDAKTLTQLLLALMDGLAFQTLNGTYGSSPEHMQQILNNFVLEQLGLDAENFDDELAELERAGSANE